MLGKCAIRLIASAFGIGFLKEKNSIFITDNKKSFHFYLFFPTMFTAPCPGNF